VVVQQLVADLERGKPLVVVDEGAGVPLAEVVLGLLPESGGAEAVRAPAQLVVDDLGVGVVHSGERAVRVEGGPVGAVVAHDDVVQVPPVGDDGDELPVVAVADQVDGVLDGHVLFKVVGVHVPAPAAAPVGAAAAHVDVVVLQVG
jgi:hypothetical protein